jgi:hypothetical protein
MYIFVQILILRSVIFRPLVIFDVRYLLAFGNSTFGNLTFSNSMFGNSKFENSTFGNSTFTNGGFSPHTGCSQSMQVLGGQGVGVEISILPNLMPKT